ILKTFSKSLPPGRRDVLPCSADAARADARRRTGWPPPSRGLHGLTLHEVPPTSCSLTGQTGGGVGPESQVKVAGEPSSLRRPGAMGAAQVAMRPAVGGAAPAPHAPAR